MITDDYGNRRFYGVYRGSVTDTKDPLNKRRIKVVVPQVLGDSSTEWIWAREDASTKTQVPAVGQGVFVMFEGGDPSHPIWMGTFGKNADSGKHALIKPLAASTVLQTSIVTATFSDGSTEIDVLATIVALANKVATLETQVAALQAYNVAHP
ncbi:hypothetical protein UFOVP46_32 [uncultured Caudovirales phage]|uniref:Gp5/Type VI secretion system Vgr protein OB-fold domain-containing protein n=1 Tax=uncultured Caudovirales phage TaxID=2100421 RepID=A0A6J5KNV0_9CAUD|nr:hypothetical protein UFOVP46_32 [uncultured Caudovirales phage]